MTLKEFFYQLENYHLRNDYIVRLAYKYSWEHEWTVQNEFLEYDGDNDCYVWLNDWDEYRSDVVVLGFICIDEVEIDEDWGDVNEENTDII